MKKLLTLFLAFTMLVTTCTHIHDENCGYNPNTNTGCTHEHDDSCFGIDPQYGYGPDDPLP